MRTLGWGGVAALTLLAGAAVAEAQPPKGKGMPDGWLSGLTGPSKPKPADDAKKDGKAPQLPPAPSRAEREQELAKLEAALLRRQAVCDQLAEVARATNNAALADEAERLSQMAFEVYRQRTQALGMAAHVPEEEAAGDAKPTPPARQPRPAGRYRPGAKSAGTSAPAAGKEGER